MNEDTLHRLFEFTLVAKGAWTVVDFVAGGVLYFFGTTPLTSFIVSVAQGELAEDPNDLFAPLFLHGAHLVPEVVAGFVVAYLFVHGVINAIFLIGLWQSKRWAYPFALIALTVFLLYQLFRVYSHFSIWLTLLCLLDACVLYLVLHEHRVRKKQQLSIGNA